MAEIQTQSREVWHGVQTAEDASQVAVGVGPRTPGRCSIQFEALQQRVVTQGLHQGGHRPGLGTTVVQVQGQVQQSRGDPLQDGHQAPGQGRVAQVGVVGHADAQEAAAWRTQGQCGHTGGVAKARPRGVDTQPGASLQTGGRGRPLPPDRIPQPVVPEGDVQGLHGRQGEQIRGRAGRGQRVAREIQSQGVGADVPQPAHQILHTGTGQFVVGQVQGHMLGTGVAVVVLEQGRHGGGQAVVVDATAHEGQVHGLQGRQAQEERPPATHQCVLVHVPVGPVEMHTGQAPCQTDAGIQGGGTGCGTVSIVHLVGAAVHGHLERFEGGAAGETVPEESGGIVWCFREQVQGQMMYPWAEDGLDASGPQPVSHTHTHSHEKQTLDAQRPVPPDARGVRGAVAANQARVRVPTDEKTKPGSRSDD